MEQVVFRKADVMNSNSGNELCTQIHAPHCAWWSRCRRPRAVQAGTPFPSLPCGRGGSRIETFSPRQCEQEKGVPSQAGTVSCWQN